MQFLKKAHHFLENEILENLALYLVATKRDGLWKYRILIELLASVERYRIVFY